MKYLVAACTFLLCCSFISFKVKEGGRSRVLYIYPLEGNNTTYLLEEYVYWPHYGAHTMGVCMLENLYVRGKAKVRRSFWCETGDTVGHAAAHAICYKGARVFEGRPLVKRLDDPNNLEVSYYRNGHIKRAVVKHLLSGDADVMEWDSLHTVCWVGSAVRKHATIRQGQWKKYDGAGRLIDSVVYK